MENHDSKLIAKLKYPALKTISSFYKNLAYLIGVLSVIGCVFFLTESSMKIVPAVVTVISGLILVLTLLAISEGILVLIDIESNTRNNKD